MDVQVEQTSVVGAPAPAVWARAMTPEGINGELRPWLRMTLPRQARGISIDEVPIGEVVGRSWILLFGVLPVEYDDLRLAALEPGRRFLERSQMATLRVWQHERVVEARGEDACQVTDRLAFELRRPLAAIPGAERLARAIVAALFRHRHRRLVAGASAAGLR